MKQKYKQIASLFLVCCLLIGSVASFAAEPGDKNMLAAAIAEAEQVTSETLAQVIPSAKTAFDTALTEAKRVYAKDDASASEVQLAYSQLQQAMWNLSYIKADKAALDALITSTAALDLSGYTTASGAAVNSALDAARAISANAELSTADQAKIDQAVTALQNAVAGLQTNQPGGNNNNSSSNNNSTKPSTPVTPPTEEISETEIPRADYLFFIDVPDGSWFYSSVYSAANAGLMRGTSEQIFSPGLEVSRAMVMTILYRLDGSPAVAAASGSLWYDAPLSWCTQEGYSDGTAPEQNITREQIVTMLYRYANAAPGTADLGRFTDGDSVSPWAVDAVKWAVDAGILNGMSDGSLCPQGIASRAELSALITRFLAVEQTER